MGCEIADYMASYGKSVTIFEMADQIGADLYPSIRANLLPRMKQYGVTLCPSATVKLIKDGVICYEIDEKVISSEPFDDVFVAVGMRANNVLEKELLEAGFEPIVIGDAVKPTKLKEVLISAVEATIKL